MIWEKFAKKEEKNEEATNKKEEFLTGESPLSF